MRHLISFLSVLFLITACNTTKKVTAVPTAAPQAPKTENALLWEISGNGLSTASYLYGTIHMIGKDDFFLTDATKTSLEKTKKVTFEINMEDMMDIANLMPLMMKAFMNGDTTLNDLLSEKDYKLIESHFEKVGLPMMFINRIKPLFLSALTGDEATGFGGENSEIKSYEMELMEMAKQQDKEIDGLETAEFQMSMFDSIPYKVQAEMLVQSLKSTDSGDDQFARMVELYKNQDLEGMQTMMQSDEEGIGDYEDLLLIRRNINWIPVMGEMMKIQPTFFAVGAGHLGGNQGVVALLRLQGYTLKPLN